MGVIQHLDELNEQWTKHLPIGTKLYTSPPKRQPLTDEQIDNLGRKEKDALLDFIYENGTASEGSDYFFKKYARSIEAAHGIKETT